MMVVVVVATATVCTNIFTDKYVYMCVGNTTVQPPPPHRLLMQKCVYIFRKMKMKVSAKRNIIYIVVMERDSIRT